MFLYSQAIRISFENVAQYYNVHRFYIRFLGEERFFCDILFYIWASYQNMTKFENFIF